MADYWKSQPKKFCDFCKCWIADNRPSVEFHEKGKRHKENVEKRLKEMTKKSCKDHKDTMKVEDQMKKMEEAALKAYMKDVEENRDFSSLLIKEHLNKRDEKLNSESTASSSVEKESKVEDIKVPPRNKIQWYEAASDEGHTYYWHVDSGDAVWEPPSEGFVSISEQKAIEDDKKVKEDLQKQEEEKKKKLEESARLEREKMKKKASKKEPKKIVPFEPIVMGPAPRKDPYGGWKTVETHVNEPIDYQLPHTNKFTVQVPVLTSEPKIKFKEKTLPVTSVDIKNEDGTVQQTDFKKRKINSNPKRNTRQRLDDDD